MQIEQMVAKACNLNNRKSDEIRDALKCKNQVVVFGNREHDGKLGIIAYCNACGRCSYQEDMVIAGAFQADL